MPSFLKAIERFEEVVVVIAFTGMFGLIFIEIVLRELFNATIYGSEEIAIICSVIAGFVGFSLVTSAGAHLRVTFLDSLLGQKREKSVARIADLVSATILGSLAVLASFYVAESYMYGDRIPVLLWKLWPFQTVIVYALGISALKHLVYFVSDTRPITEPKR